MDVKLSRIYITNNTGVKKPAGYSSAGWMNYFMKDTLEQGESLFTKE